MRKRERNYIIIFGVIIWILTGCHKFDENILLLHHPQGVLEHGVWEIQSYTINGEEHLGETRTYSFYEFDGYNASGEAVPGISIRKADKRIPYHVYHKPTRRGSFIGTIVVAFDYPHNASNKYPVFLTPPHTSVIGSWKVVKLTGNKLKMKVRDSLNNEHIAILKKKKIF